MFEWERKIVSCFINKTEFGYNEIYVIYDDSSREVIWHYDPTRFNFDYKAFIGMTKLEAAFYCDRKEPRKKDGIRVG